VKLSIYSISGSAQAPAVVRETDNDGRPESTVTRWREAEFNVIANVEITPFGGMSGT
jgi:hypothetical protein